MNRLGIYWSVMHRRREDYEYFNRLQPTVFKLMDAGRPDYTWAAKYLSGATILARDWALSEQHSDMLRDPDGTGRRHAQEWYNHKTRLGFDPAKTLILGINEPHVWEAGVAEALRVYTIALCGEAHALGLRVGAMQLSVGWPNNRGSDTPPDWSPWHGVEDAIKRGNHALICHEYWANEGAAENWGWWCGRALKCPWQVPIIIGECGIDMYVKDASVAHETRGWLGRIDPQRYASELVDYVRRMSADKRFVGACVFASDFANREWSSFDVAPAYEAILAIPVPVEPETKPHTVHLPTISNGGTVSQPELVSGIVDPLVAEAILVIESGGDGLNADGSVKIRFEAHIFKAQLKDDALWANHFRHGTPSWTGQQMHVDGAWKEIHTGSQSREWQAYEKAKRISPIAAANSISMGAAQIMGFNHKRVGYVTAIAMLDAFENEIVQTIAFLNFLLSDPILWLAVRNHDFDEVARRYNGAGNVEVYSKLLADAYARIKG